MAAKNHDSLLTAVLSCVADGVFTVDERFRITSFNRRAERITGVAAGTGVSFLVMATLLLLFLAKRFPGNRDDWRSCLTASAGSFLVMTALIIVIGLALPLPSLPLLFAAAVRAVTFAAATALVWGLARRRIPLLREERA